jgi:hypothetical protein
MGAIRVDNDERISGCAFSQTFSSGVRVTIDLGTVFCALTRSALKPKLKISNATYIMVKDLCMDSSYQFFINGLK